MKKKDYVKIPETFIKNKKICKNDMTLKFPRPAPKRPKANDSKDVETS